ncbi:hypothetical protein ACVW0P_004361 [Mucilaginibacter sp. UYNi724]
MKTRLHNLITTAVLLLAGTQLFAQAPAVTYTTPQNLTVGTGVTITPSNSGGAVTTNPAYTVTTFAGQVGAGSADNTGPLASFNNPVGIARDASGNLYIADPNNNKIRKITTAGVVTTFAGSGAAGAADGTGTGATFNAPFDITIVPSGNLYVADYSNNSIRKITPAGVVTTFATVTAPAGILYNSVTGTLFASSYTTHTILQISATGTVTTFAGSGTQGANNATGTAATFFNPVGITDDGNGFIFVADQGNNLIRKITAGGIVSTYAGSGVAGSADGIGTAATFNRPSGISIANGNIYVGDVSNNKIRMITMPGTVVTTIAGTGTAGAGNGTGATATFNGPWGIQADGTGNLYIADRYSNQIRKLAPTSGYTVNTPLPTGLSLNNVTGVISGTPTVVTAAANYIVTATNPNGTNSTTINISVANSLSTPIDNNPAANTANSYSAIGTTTGVTAFSTINGNIALNAPVTVSSLEAGATYPGSAAVDGAITGARWSSAFSDPQSIIIDLGNTYTVSQVTLYWEAAYGKAYSIDISATNGFGAGTYTTLYSTTNGDGNIDDLTGLSGTGRYIRMYGTQRAIAAGYSLFEFQVYGTTAITYALTTNPSSYFAINSTTGVVTLASATVPAGAYTIGVTSTATGLGQTSSPASFAVNIATATPTISGSSAGCGAGSVTLTAAGGQPTGGVYNWYGTATGNAVLATGTTFAPITSGSYYVDYTSGGVTSGRSTAKIVTINPIVSSPIAAAVLSYPLDGNTNDVSGNQNNGVGQNTPAFTANRYTATPGAYSANGSTQYITSTTPFVNPQTFSLSLWFNTNTPSGGKLIGFSSQQAGGGQRDRQIYMNNAGQLYFGVYNGATNTVNTAGSYNDGNWHHVVGTFSPTNGIKLYVDNVLQAANATYTAAETYTGYWSIGGNTLTGWPSIPTSAFFAGSIDDVAVYSTELSVATVTTSNDNYQIGAYGPICVGSPLTLYSPIITGATYSWTDPNGAVLAGTSNSTTFAAAIAGTYTLTVTNGPGGCSSTANYTPTLNALPAATITGPTTVATATAAAFSTTPVAGVTYAWTTDGGTPATGTGTAISVTWATAGLKKVTLTATNTNGCSVSTTQTIAVTKTVASGNYVFSQPITVAALGNTATLANFPMLVYIKEDALKSGINCANNVQFPTGLSATNGYDFAFTTNGGTDELFYQVESFDATNGILTAWVQVPSVTSAATQLSFYFGSTAPAHDASFAYGTWSSDYLAVYHFNEGSGTVLDATTNQRSATATNATSTTSGKISSAYAFNGTSTKIISATAADATGNFTLSGWAFVTDFATSSDQKIVTNESSYASGGYKLGYYGSTTTNVKTEVETRSYSGAAALNRGEAGGTIVTTGQWHYVQGVYNGTNFITYFDGVSDRGATTGVAAGTGGPIYIGSDFASANFFKGTMDEIRVSNVAKPADWIKAEYNNQNNYLTYTTTNTAITATSAAAVSAIGGGIPFAWKTTATTTDPATAANWTSSSGSIPSVAVLAPPLDGTVTLTIPNTTSNIYPKLRANAIISGLTLSGNTATLDLNGFNLSIGCNIYNSNGGQITSTNGASGLSWTGAVASQTYTGSATANTAKLGNMTINNSVSGTVTVSGGPIDIYTSLNFTKGNLTIAPTTTLTLKSDATATAYVAAVPTASTLTGLVSAERYVSGSPTSLARRGYRLMSSPVYAATVAGNNVYDLNFLKASSIVTGVNGATNGFTAGTSATANASVYLFREDLVPGNTTFASGNFKGITQLNNSPVYNYGINAVNTLTNTNDSQTYLPVGNGFLFFFRGNNTLNTAAQTGTKTTSPYDYPENVTFTQTGTLNRGTVVVRPWASGSNVLLYSTTIANNVAPNNIRGYNLVGNPYAATINWEKFNRNGVNSSIYGGTTPAGTPISTTIYQFNSTSKQYASYIPKATVGSVADTTSTINTGATFSSDGVVSNMISSGQGFFVIANASGQTLTFRESAKTTTQAAAANVITLMSTSLPPSGDQSEASMRIKLVKDDVNTDAFSIVLNNNTDTKYVLNEDAIDLGGNGAQVSLTAYSSDDVPLSINRLPLPKLQPQVIPVLVDATTDGLYSLKLQDLNGLPSIYQVWLMDNFKKDSLDLRAHNTYNFNILKGTPESFGKERFKIVVRQNAELALRLLDFNGIKVTGGNKLAWTVENEANYTNFTVERSTDGGKTFEVIGGLLSTGKGTYTLIDKNPPKGTTQYRLKQDDINGAISYSEIVTLMYANTNGLTDRLFNIYPNPVINMVNVAITDPEQKQEATYTIKISNGSGIIVRTTKSAKASWQDNVGNLYPGTYFVQVINNSTKKVIGTGKFVKL